MLIFADFGKFFSHTFSHIRVPYPLLQPQLYQRRIAVYDAKGNLELNGDSMQSKVMATMFALFAELERDFISQRTKEALRARKAAGVKLGRPKGPGKSKLDPYRDEILALLKTGVPKTKVAGKYSVKTSTLYNWLKKNEIHVESDLSTKQS